MPNTSPPGPNAINPGIPSEPGFFARAHRRRMVEIGSLLSAVAALLYGVLYLVGGTPVFLVVNFFATAAFILVGFARPLSVTARLFGAITVGELLFGVQLALVADISNGITPWLLVPPIAAVIMGERRLTLYATTIAIAEPTLVVLAAKLGLLHAQFALPYEEPLMLLSLVGVLAICAAFAWISHSTRLALQRAVDARTAALASALATARAAEEEAIAASAAKDAFFANLTHEIRTPLTGIAGTAELLADTELSGEQRQFADALLASTRSLTALVNAMLDHARLAAGHASLDLNPVAPRDIARDLESLYRPKAEEQGLAFVVVTADRVPERVESDRIRLHQVLANLVSNALKFTDRGAVRLALDWESSPEAGRGTLVGSVADTGAGIAPELQAAVFEPFVQGDASIRRAHGGTGLGLAISRQLAELLGGTVTLSSEVEVGSTFTLRVPAALVSPRAASEASAAKPSPSSSQTRPVGPAPIPAAQPDRPAASAPAPPSGGGNGHDRRHAAPAAAPDALSGLRVLLVEDNDINRTVATAMLRRSGVEVLCAADGHEAVRLATTTPVDLILMDLQMPGLDGIEATRRIRATEQGGGRRLPIVAMTGNAPEDYGDACEAAGMDAFVMKPVTAARLLEVVARTLARA